jgi:hypothetical protein
MLKKEPLQIIFDFISLCAAERSEQCIKPIHASTSTWVAEHNRNVA